MFSRIDSKTFPDLSAELNDEADWQAGTLKTFQQFLDVCAVAYEPVSGLLAVGNKTGSIVIYGAPGVEQKLYLPDPIRIRYLAFATSPLKILCTDDIDRMHVWDLTSPGKPRLQHIMNFRNSVNSLALSPSHTHVLVALGTGEIKTYDLLCSRQSSFSIPNMWTLYEEKLVASGNAPVPTPGSRVPVDILIHPRDLNLLLVAYGGGVILSDLAERNTLRAYEHVLPPGAPGGNGYHSPDILTHRRPSVTAIAIHPAGHFFAVGYADGTICFWALEDEDKPLMVRNLDEVDLNAVDGAKLEDALGNPHGGSLDGEREPIFKLAWSGFSNSSDPRGGETTLTILGGLGVNDPPGVTIFTLPAFNPPAPPTTTETQTTLHPSFRLAMQESLKPIHAFTYFTKGIVQDFLLLSKGNPHFAGNFDPTAILLVSDGYGDTRAIEAFEFPPPPPPALSPITPSSPPAKSPISPDGEDEDALVNDIASTLEEMQVSSDPHQLVLPFGLWNGHNGITGGSLVAISKAAYELVIGSENSNEPNLRLHGGVAWVDDNEGEMKLMKLQPHRLLITQHRDLKVRFQDLSAQLLISSDESPLTSSFPNLLPALTIDLTSVLTDPAVFTRTSSHFIDEARIDSVFFATESLECAISLKSGDVILYRLISEGTSTSHVNLQDEELISMQHIPLQVGERFRPLLMIMSNRGKVTACALSDVGFLAVAYEDGSTFIVDMRGPRLILRDTVGAKSHRHSFLGKHENEPVTQLTWTVSGTASDLNPRIILIATYESGSATFYSVTRSSTGTWEVKEPHEFTEATSHPLSESIVIDAKTGVRCKANRDGLSIALNPPAPEERRRTIWISAGAKGVKCTADLSGEKLGKIDWPATSKVGQVIRVEVIKKLSASVLVAFTDKRNALVYSIPTLEWLHTLQFEQSPTETFSVDETGDYIEWIRHEVSGLIGCLKYGTVFNVRRSGPYLPPTIDFKVDERVIPPQPQPVSIGPASFISSWLGYISSQGMTGEQVDALLAGPDRPIPQPVQRSQPAASGSKTAAGGTNLNARDIAASAASTAGDLYSRLGAALAERGEMLGSLQESFDSLEQGSKRMVEQTKSLAAQQTARRWFGL
ncbi:lethal giant larvae like, C-terminal-domain-containing protein [Abortiporus biennis]|nr:lethal giant larvae like, C-terminal-domain-containing protein [Abortiporus biennis]